MKKLNIAVRSLAALLLLGALGMGCVAAINYYVEKTGSQYVTTAEQLAKADCIIVPGAQVIGEQVSYTLSKRLETALQHYESGAAPKIIVSGDHGQQDYNEVKAMREYLVSRGVEKENIFMDHAGFSSYDTIYRAKEVFCAQSAIIVTQQEHLLRCLYIAKKLDLPAQGVACRDYEPYERGVQIQREYLARAKAFLYCEILHPKPRYLGEAIPVSGSGLITDDGK